MLKERQQDGEKNNFPVEKRGKNIQIRRFRGPSNRLFEDDEEGQDELRQLEEKIKYF